MRLKLSFIKIIDIWDRFPLQPRTVYLEKWSLCSKKKKKKKKDRYIETDILYKETKRGITRDPDYDIRFEALFFLFSKRA